MNRYDLVLLGLILEHERSGYDIITEIRDRELDRWAKISTSTVYNRLITLEKNGCIVGHAERDGAGQDTSSKDGPVSIAKRRIPNKISDVSVPSRLFDALGRAAGQIRRGITSRILKSN